MHALARFCAVLAALSSFAAASGNPSNSDFCCAVTEDVSRWHGQSAATSYCSSFLSIGTKTTTVGSTRYTTKPAATSTITTTSTVTASSGSGIKTVTAPISATATATATVTSTSTNTVTNTATATATTTSTVVVSVTSTTSTVSTTTTAVTSTTTELDPNFTCFTGGAGTKRDVAKSTGYPTGDWWGGNHGGYKSKQISSFCSCLSITSQTETVTSAPTVTKTASHGTTVTVTATAKPTTIVSTITTTIVAPSTTSTVTPTTTVTITTTATVVQSVTTEVTTTTTSTATTSVSTTTIQTSTSTSTATSTSTVTTQLGSDLTFKIVTNAGAASSGGTLYAAAAVSGPPYNFFYFRSQSSGATTYILDENCQLLETFAGVYAQNKPSDPNPGIVYSGSGVPVTCELDIANNDLSCANPGGGDTTFLCDTTFGANSYQLWWLGEDNSPGSRCNTHNIYASYTL